MLLRRHQDFFRFREVEVAALAKNIAAFGKLFLSHGRQHLVNDERHILLRCAAKLFWDGVRAKERRHKFNRCRLVQLPDDTQNLSALRQATSHSRTWPPSWLSRNAETSLRAFARAREAGLHLRRVFCARSSEFRHLCGDLFVSRTPRAHLEFIHPVPGENGMSMRIHETRQNDPTLRVHDLHVVRQFVARSRPKDRQPQSRHPGRSSLRLQ